MARNCERLSGGNMDYMKIVMLVAISLCLVEYAVAGRIDLENQPLIIGIKSKRGYSTRVAQDNTLLVENNSAPQNDGGSSQTRNGDASVFVTRNSTTVVAQIGGTARLPCIVHKFNNGVVSWMKQQTLYSAILTVGLNTYSSDDRFRVEHKPHLQNYNLVILRVTEADSGLYQCQVSAHPISSIFVHLSETESLAEIQGAPDIHIHPGSALSLTCNFRHNTESPEYVFWYHEHDMINHDQGVEVTSNDTTSVLKILDADSSRIGNYTCYPSNAAPASVMVHVLNETEDDYSAAVLHSNGGQQLSSTAFYIILYSCIFCNFFRK